MDYLVFRLYGPMASWGQAAVGGDRPSGMAPGRGALLGMMCAALGIRREQDDDITRLGECLEFAVKQKTEGTLLRDYHTVQTPSEDKKRTYRTRKEELSGPKNKLNTVLSSRDYRMDGVWIIAVAIKDGANAEASLLAQLQQALLTPVFPLYLGRKSCPPALPLKPKLVAADCLKDALDTPFPGISATLYDPEKDTDAYWLGIRSESTYYWQGELSGLDGKEHGATLTYHPWDDPISRTRWQFGQRQQHQLTLREDG